MVSLTEWYHSGIGSYLARKQEKLDGIARKYNIPKDSFDYSMREFVTNEPVTDISEFATLIQACSDLRNGNWTSLQFRGEGERYPTTQITSFFRSESERDTEAEIAEVRLFQETTVGKGLMEKFNEVWEKNPDENQCDPADHPWWWLLTQHHAEDGKKTRMLDITRNPFVALYYACINEKQEEGMVYIFLDADVHKITMPTPGIPIPDRNYVQYTTLDDFVRDRHKMYQVGPLVSIDYSKISLAYELVKRVVAQSGEFLMQMERSERRQTWSIPIFGESKKRILKQLEGLINISESTLMVDALPTSRV